MNRFPVEKSDRSSVFALAGTLWLCCALIIGGVLFAVFGWQAGVMGIIVTSAVVLLIAWMAARR